MEPARFDALVQRLTRPGSRRRALGVVLATVLAPAAAAAKPAPAACLPIGKRCSQAASAGAGQAKGKRKGKGKPPACGKCCSRFGAPDPNGKARCTCKGEGVACDSASQCCGGQCKSGSCTGCPGDTVFCSDGCADLQTNNQHCGSCDTACTAGQRCVNGSCVCDATSCPNGCCAGTTCKRGDSTSACGDGGAPCAICQTGDICNDGTCDCVSGVICTGTGCCSSADQVCDQNDQCCTPATQCPAGQNCDTAPDGCGGTLPCGTCTAPQTCGGGGTPKQCGCTPTTCAAGQCGQIDDGCGGTLNCTCPAPQVCGTLAFSGTGCCYNDGTTKVCTVDNFTSVCCARSDGSVECDFNPPSTVGTCRP